MARLRPKPDDGANDGAEVAAEVMNLVDGGYASASENEFQLGADGWSKDAVALFKKLVRERSVYG